MSMTKPCLPVNRHRRKRDRKRERDEDDASSGRGDIQKDADADVDDDEDEGLIHEPIFADVEHMDAATYLRLVNAEAQRLPLIFTASTTALPSKDVANRKRSMAAVYGANGKDEHRSNQRTRRSKLPMGLSASAAAAAQYLVSDQTLVRPPPTERHVPVGSVKRSWVDQTLDNFAKLRDYLEDCRQNGAVNEAKEPMLRQGHDDATTITSPLSTKKRVPVPAMKDASGWHVFCVGYDDACGNAGGYFQDDDDEADDEANDVDNELNSSLNKNGHDTLQEEVDTAEPPPPPWKLALPSDGYQPTVSLLLQLDQVMVRRVLGHLTHYVVQGFAVMGPRAAWLYALLARLECPIHRDDAVTMYTLLKQMTLVREQMVIPDNDASTEQSNQSTLALPSSNRHCLASLNTLIAIVGIYFEQGGGYASVMEVKS